ncbi:MAG: methyl-accepting chemotaxis protein [Gammaproteobacteria bacterium]|nr:methyl-accepting chemotaxis protein [Gammaproteobacteria bacterium]
MNWILDIRIRYKILFLSVMGIGGILIYFAYNYLVASANAERLTEIRDVAYPMLENTDINLVRLDNIKVVFGAAAAEGEEELLTEADKLAAAIQKTFMQMVQVGYDDAAVIEKIQREFSRYFTLAREMTTGIINDSLASDQILKKAEAMNMAMKNLQEDLQAFREKTYINFTGKITETDEAAQQALMFGLVIGVVVLISLLIATPLIISMITGNLNQVIGSLKEMATGKGDLTQRLKSRSNDELGELAQWFNRFIEQLQSVIAELKETSVQLSSSASEVSVITSEGSQQVARQESETELVATAINEMAATVQEVASHANSAANATQEADQEARQGQQIVASTVDAIDALSSGINNAAEVIHKLESDSQEIGTVLDVIRGIAEQTNLLALNAAIEAARAGDQGRGFAVVADEVRTLASRTQESTQEIDQMIERLQGGSRDAVKVMNASREQAQSLVGQAARAGESLQTITQAVNNITDMNLQIASATEEQSNVALGIDASIVTIRDISVEAARSAEQASNNSEKVVALADKVQNLVNQFKV